MRAVVQRVTGSSVKTTDESGQARESGSIRRGLTILLGVTHDDDQEDIKYLRDKIVNLRIFPEQEGGVGFEKSALDVGAEILMVSQFTLYATTRKGRRPGFTDAAPGDVSEPMFNAAVEAFRESGLRVETGVFGARMLVELENDGPATFILDSLDRGSPRRG
ncbi:MAG: D-aminoacyl-tRNA deacylase [Chloroflexota bacterium]